MQSDPLFQVVLTDEVADDLIEIVDHASDRFGAAQAERYEAFLKESMADLAIFPRSGRPVENRPGLRRKTVRWRAGGDGHHLVYRVDEASGVVTVLRLLHTRMDLASRLGA